MHDSGHRFGHLFSTPECTGDTSSGKKDRSGNIAIILAKTSVPEFSHDDAHFNAENQAAIDLAFDTIDHA